MRNINITIADTDPKVLESWAEDMFVQLTDLDCKIVEDERGYLIAETELGGSLDVTMYSDELKKLVQHSHFKRMKIVKRGGNCCLQLYFK